MALAMCFLVVQWSVPDLEILSKLDKGLGRFLSPYHIYDRSTTGQLSSLESQVYEKGEVYKLLPDL